MQVEKFEYLPGDRYFPEHEPQIATAEFVMRVAEGRNKHVEGLCFDRDRNLYFTGIYNGTVNRVNLETKKHEVIFENPNWKPTAVKVHKDGRLFVTSIGGMKGVYEMNPDGTGFRPVLPGWSVDDMVFDSEGGFYITRYEGNILRPTGGVYYVSPSGKELTPILEHMAAPNGIALSTDGEILWVTETSGGNLYRLRPALPNHSSVPYHFEGYLGPDSCSIDEDDNLYVAMVMQGQVMVFNPRGFLMARVLLPDRDKGQSLHSSHPMVHPDTKELYIIAGDDERDMGSCIFKAPAFAKGHAKAFQFT